MPFKRDDIIGLYTPEQLSNLQSTYDRVCEILTLTPISDAEKEAIARLLITIYEAGEQDPKIIANLILEIGI